MISQALTYDLVLTKGIDPDQIIMEVLQEKQLFITHSVPLDETHLDAVRGLI